MTAPVRASRPTRVAGIVAAAVLALVSLSACIKLDAEMTIDSDAKATGTLALELQKQAASVLGVTSIEDFEGGLSEGDLGGQGLTGLGDCAASETDAAYVYSCTFADTAFTEAGSGPWTITKDGSSIVMRVVNEGQSADAEGADALLGDASLGSLSITATFPGPITAITGEGATKTSDSTAQIDASLTDTVDITITSDATGSGSLAMVLTIVVAIAVVGLIVLVAIVLLMRRRKGDAETPDAETPVGEAGTVAETTVTEVTATEATATEVTEVTEVTATETPDAPSDQPPNP